MKSFFGSMWKGIGTTGQILLCCFVFYFVCKTLKN